MTAQLAQLEGHVEMLTALQEALEEREAVAMVISGSNGFRMLGNCLPAEMTFLFKAGSDTIVRQYIEDLMYAEEDDEGGD